MISPTQHCLDDVTLAALVDGSEFAEKPSALSHIATCTYCRHRLSAIARAVSSPEVSGEIDALERAPLKLASRRVTRRVFVAGGLAAAAVAVVLLRPVLREPAAREGVTRESAITSTVAPRIVSPRGLTGSGEMLRWTRVPEADAYRVRVWNQEGDVVWSSETRDTTLLMPPELKAETTYLWEVNARIGWDRWVASDFIEFRIGTSNKR